MNKRSTHMKNRRNKLLKQKKFKGINLITREKELIESRVSKIYEVLTHATECFPRTFGVGVKKSSNVLMANGNVISRS